MKPRQAVEVAHVPVYFAVVLGGLSSGGSRRTGHRNDRAHFTRLRLVTGPGLGVDTLAVGAHAETADASSCPPFCAPYKRRRPSSRPASGKLCYHREIELDIMLEKYR